MENTGLWLYVTVRPDVRTSIGWNQVLLDDYLNSLENDPELRAKTEDSQQRFITIENGSLGAGSVSEGDVLILNFLKYELKQEYREKKLKLECVHFFGAYNPPSSGPTLQGEGSGLVILDIDLKELGTEIPLNRLDLVRNEVVSFYHNHRSAVFLYQTFSGVGFHLGLLTDARTPETYTLAFKQLVEECKGECPLASHCIDTSVGSHSRCFFKSHSAWVLRKPPTAVYITKAVLPSPALPSAERLSGAHVAFPYQQDFRLFLAYKRRAEQTYFDDYPEWVKLMYALKATYPLCYSSRLREWFEQLSALSPRFNSKEDIETFESLLDQDTFKGSGVDYIIDRLSRTGATTQFPEYSRDDLEEYNDDVFLRNMDVSDIPDPSILVIDKYLSEIRDSIDVSQSFILESPPGTGKSHFVTKEMKGKRVILLPTLILVLDLQKHIPVEVSLQIVTGDVPVDDIQNSTVILSTYEGLSKVIESNVPKSEYTLIMDEAHNLFTSAAHNFRFATMQMIESRFHRFKNVILLSGSWIPFDFTFLPLKHIKILLRESKRVVLEVVTTPNPLNSLAEECLAEQGEQILLVNNRKENVELENLIRSKRQDAKVSVVNSDTKEDDSVKRITNGNELLEGEIVVGTQMIVEGISLNNPGIKAVRFYHNQLPEMIAQLSRRPRKANPVIKYYCARQTFKLSASCDYAYTRNKVKLYFENMDVQGLPREELSKSAIQIYYKPTSKGKTRRNEYTAWVQMPKTKEPQLHPLLLANFTLKEVSKALNIDLFSMMMHLRKWNFTFDFTTMGVSTVRQDFKEMQLDEQKELIRWKFRDIAALPREVVEDDSTDLVNRAWSVLQCVEGEYFEKMHKDERVDVFANKRKFQKLVEDIQGCAVVKGFTFRSLESLVNAKYVKENVEVLKKFKKVTGFLTRIHHPDVEQLYSGLGLTPGDIKKILRQQYNLSDPVSTTVQHKKVRFFNVKPKEHDFLDFLKWDNAIKLGSSPFHWKD